MTELSLTPVRELGYYWITVEDSAVAGWPLLYACRSGYYGWVVPGYDNMQPETWTADVMVSERSIDSVMASPLVEENKALVEENEALVELNATLTKSNDESITALRLINDKIATAMEKR